MTRPKLYLHKDQSVRGSCSTLGMVYTISSIIEGGVFDIEYHNDFLSTMRDYRATTIYYDFNGVKKKIYLDFWEYQAPTHTNEVLNANYDLIIKLQHIPVSSDRYLQLCQQQATFIGKDPNEIVAFLNKIIPWSFFPSRIFEPYVGREEVLWGKPTERVGFFCGKDWRCRRAVKKWVGQNGMEYLCSRNGESDGTVISDQDFLHKMQTSRFGIVASGRGSWITEGKNRREIDYMMLKKPLLLNYKPNYYFPMVEGEHYIYWQGEPIKELESKYDIEKIGENGYQWYLKHASKKSMGLDFKKILDDKFKETLV